MDQADGVGTLEHLFADGGLFDRFGMPGSPAPSVASLSDWDSSQILLPVSIGPTTPQASSASSTAPVLCVPGCASLGAGDEAMVGCDNIECKHGAWFHFKCVGLRKAPSKDSKWSCPGCIADTTQRLAGGQTQANNVVPPFRSDAEERNTDYLVVTIKMRHTWTVKRWYEKVQITIPKRSLDASGVANLLPKLLALEVDTEEERNVTIESLLQAKQNPIYLGWAGEDINPFLTRSTGGRRNAGNAARLNASDFTTAESGVWRLTDDGGESARQESSYKRTYGNTFAYWTATAAQ